MFLTSPTSQELQLLELPLLIEMLSVYTDEYIRILQTEGFTTRTGAAKELLLNIQAAIEAKKNSEKSAMETASAIVPAQGENIQLIKN